MPPKLELNSLFQKRTIILNKIDRFKEYLDDYETNKRSITQLKLRAAKFETYWDDFGMLQDNIELLISPHETQKEQSVRQEFEEKYFTCLDRAQTYISIQDSSMISNDRNLQSANILDDLGIKLQPISLPKFDGKYEDWLSFADVYNSAIHNNRKISTIGKFYSLRSCLTGTAANIIKNIETTEQNYQGAWELIVKRFSNKKLIIHKHVTSLFELPKIGKENPTEIRALLDNTLKHLQALKALGEPTEAWDTLLVYLTSTKFDNITFRAWLEFNQQEITTMELMIDFLTKRCRILEGLPQTQSIKSPPNSININKHKTGKFHDNNGCLHSKIELKCKLCSKPHMIYNCPDFLNLSIDNRIKRVHDLNLCGNCLKANNHTLEQCKSGNCKFCAKRHNSYLHLEPPRNEPQCNNQLPMVSAASNGGANVILSTAFIRIVNANGEAVPCRVLLDCGSQSNFLTESICNYLGLRRSYSDVPVSGINGVSTQVAHKTTAIIKSTYGDLKCTTKFLIVPQITSNIPCQKINHQEGIFPDVPLADPTWNTPSKVDGLLGAQLFWDLLLDGYIEVENHPITLRKTKLGWIVCGSLKSFKSSPHPPSPPPVHPPSSPPYHPPVHPPPQAPSHPPFHPPSRAPHSSPHLALHSYSYSSAQMCQVASLNEVDEHIQAFWKLEELTSTSVTHTGEDKLCERHFENTVQRANDGRYIVQLPLRQDPSSLGDSKQSAFQRFLKLESKLVQQPQLYEDYKTFMNEYLRLNHMKESDSSPSVVEYYIPHHCIRKESSSTTKLRVVFDASAKTSSGISLNDILMVGPIIQDSLSSILLRFRTYNYIMTADVEKMYRQILMDSSQTALQKIFWRESPNDKLKIYELNTITYGTASAPYLATRAMKQLFKDEGSQFPHAAAAVNDFYMDDLLTGFNTVTEGLQKQAELIQILDRGKLHLRKWCSTHDELLQHISEIDQEPLQTFTFQAETASAIKTLGLIFDPGQDAFRFSVKNTHYSRLTKRKIIPVYPIDAISKLHAFSDASESAYGGTFVYIRSVDRITDSSLGFHLLFSKSRVAEEIKLLKKQTPLPKSSKSTILYPFLCGKNLLRVGGRIIHSDLPQEQKNPVILPPNHHITRMIARDKHEELLHCGTQTFLPAVRLQYWPINGRHLINSIIKGCIHCFKVKPTFSAQLVVNLSHVKVNQSRPFTHTDLSHLGPTMGPHFLSFVNLYTFLTEIEAIINYMSLFPLSNDPTDFSYITPFHFLVGTSLTDLPEPNWKQVPCNRLNQWQLVQGLAQSFWSLWQRFYLWELQQRTRWKIDQPNLTEGTLVLIRDDRTAPMTWTVGRVIDLHTGSDLKVRVVSIKTPNGIKCSVATTRICPLPLGEDQVIQF